MIPKRIPTKGFRRLEDWSLKRYLGHHFVAFESAMFDQNLRRLLVINLVLMFTETIMLILPEPGISYHYILIWFLIANSILIVVLWITLDQPILRHVRWRQCVVITDMGIKFALTMALSLSSVGVVDHLHLVIGAMYMMITVVYLRNLTYGIVLTLANLVYAWILSSMPVDANQRFILVSNLIIFALGAGMIGTMINRDRATTFKSKQDLEDLLKRDIMTKFYNHDTILELIEREVELAKADQQPLSILMLDLDDFKAINDQHGHLKGDEVLLQVVEVLRKSTRTSDLIGRYGGEEFLILFTRTELAVAHRISERIRSAIEAINITGITVTVSGGLTQLSDESAQALIQMADDKLYEAKRSGKNRIIIT
jgi:diguanylate cyclase (GGDEF)-like protein